MKPFLLALRAQVIPAALIPFLYDIRPPVSFVDGCLVVEIQDHRKSPEIRSRIVMRPAPETLPLTIDIMLERRHETWDEAMTLELESRIMVSEGRAMCWVQGRVSASQAAMGSSVVLHSEELLLLLKRTALFGTGCAGVVCKRESRPHPPTSRVLAVRTLFLRRTHHPRTSCKFR